MADYTYSNNNTVLEELFVTWDEVGMVPPYYISGKLFAWGQNANSDLGVGNQVLYNSPIQIGSDTKWREVSLGTRSAAAIKSDGTLWTWGYNGSGQLGTNNLAHRSVPIQVGTATNWKQVVVGPECMLGIQSDSSLWGWGEGAVGILGSRSVPTQVYSEFAGSVEYTWKQVAVGGRDMLSTFSAAIKKDGTLWTWGHNSYGQLGQNDTSSINKPTRVGSDTNWKHVSAGDRYIVALKVDNTLWVSGEAGLAVNTSSPVQVGSDKTWKYVSAGGKHTLAIKLNGSLWAWGDNSSGQLGLNDAGINAHRSSPTMVGSLYNWKQAVSNEVDGDYYSIAVKTDGTLWSWGNNSYGQLGLGDSGVGTHRSSPTLVGTLANWRFVSPSKSSNTIAIQI